MRQPTPTVDATFVFSQTPKPGDHIPKNNFVTIYVSTGPPKTEVPNVVGEQLDQALSDLQDAKLKGKTVQVESDKPQGQVISQSPTAGASVEAGSDGEAQGLEGAETGGGPERDRLDVSSRRTRPCSRMGFAVSREVVKSDAAEGHGHRHEPGRRDAPAAGHHDHPHGVEGADHIHGP